jgi:hypothetical protein
MAGRKIRDVGDARECLDAARASGLARAQWAHENGVDARSLNAWRLNLERRRRRPTLRVVELVPAAPATTASPLRVQCGPFVIEVAPDFDDDALARLLAVMASC